MACPYFQPTKPVKETSIVGGRLPLIEEYEGNCTASAETAPVEEDLRRECCNQGYTRGRCARLPQVQTVEALRFSVVRRTPDALEVLCIAEKNYSPLWFRQARYAISVDSLAAEDLEPSVAALALAYCRSYLRLQPTQQ